MTTYTDGVRPLPIPRRDQTPWLRIAMVFLACVVVADSLFGDRGWARAYARSTIMWRGPAPSA